MKGKIIIVSACLVGIPCRYSAEGALNENIQRLATDNCLVPVCPEQLGGLPTPRAAAEIRAGRVVTVRGEDVTEEFRRGAAAVLSVVRLISADMAILKSRSPSCGVGQIYDGTFTGSVTVGNGITAALLMSAGIAVSGDDSFLFP